MARPCLHNDERMSAGAFRLTDRHFGILDRLDRGGLGRSAVLRRLLDAIDNSAITIDRGGVIIANGGGIAVDQRAAAAE